MAEGRDEVGAARDWLRQHGVSVPDGDGFGTGTVGAATVTDRVAAPAGDLQAPETTDGEAPDGGRRGDRSAVSRRGRGRQDRRADGRRSVRGRGADASDRSRVAEGDGPDADPEQVARTIVLRKLAAQARTRAELERALATKEVPEEAAEAVLDRMSEVGLVDDAAFARDWVASRQQRRHLSRTALRRELQTKGVERDLIDDALADVDGSDEHEAATDLARRRAATMTGLPREVAYRRLGGMLARRGFSSSVTARVLSEVLGSTHED